MGTRLRQVYAHGHQGQPTYAFARKLRFNAVEPSEVVDQCGTRQLTQQDKEDSVPLYDRWCSVLDRADIDEEQNTVEIA